MCSRYFWDKRSGLYKTLGILLFFGFFSLFCIYFFIQSGKISANIDAGFHFSRVEEIYQNLRDRQLFTFIATHTFHGSGAGSFLFYPTVFLYPWALCRLIFSPITSFYLWYGGMLFLTLCCSYYAMLRFANSRQRAVLFAVFYTVGSYHLFLGIFNYVLGEFIAYTFLPLAFCGFYEIFYGDEHYWPILSVGLTLIFYSHLLSTVITFTILVFLFIFTLCSQKIIVNRWMSLFKAVIVTLILSAWQLVPFLTDYLKGDLAKPQPGFYFLCSMQEIWAHSLENIATNHGIGFGLILAAVFGWHFIRKDKREQTIYLLGIIFLILATDLVPYGILKEFKWLGFLQVIQFPYRFLAYASLFLSATLSLMLSQMLDKIGNKKKYFGLGLLLIFALSSYFSSILPALQRVQNQDSTALLVSPTDKFSSVEYGKLLTKENYDKFFEYVITYGETDYFPKESFSDNQIVTHPKSQGIILQEAYIDGRTEKIPAKAMANAKSYQVTLNKISEVDLPFVMYPRTKVYINGKEASFKISSRGTALITLPRGKTIVTLCYKPVKIYYYLWILAIIGWGSLIIIGVKQKFRSL